MAQPLSAYEGNDPYIFVTYAHEDADLVHPQIRWLQDQGFHVWWDEGISPGAAWRAELAESIQHSSLLLYFITPQSVLSDHCTREVNFALDEHHRPVLAVHLVETTLPGALALSLSDRQAIFQHALLPTDYERKLLSAVATYLDQPLPEISKRAPHRRSSQRRTTLLIGTTSMLVGAAIAAFASWMFTHSEEPLPKPPSRFALDMPPNVTIDRFGVDPLVISGDGRRIIFRSRTSEGSRLYARQLEDLETTPIIESASEVSAFDVSPDGDSVIFWDGKLIKRGQISGGPTMTIREVVSASLGLDWGRDGTIAFSEGFYAGSRLMATDTSGRQIAALTQPAEGEGHILPHLLENGSAVLYAVVKVGSVSAPRIEALSLETGELKSLVEGVSPQVSSSGHLLFGRDSAIWATPFDAKRLKLTEEAVVVLEDVAFTQMFTPIFDIAEDGSMVYLRSEEKIPTWTFAWMDSNGNSTKLLTVQDKAPPQEPRISPDGRQVAIRRTDSNLWVLALDHNVFTKLSDDLVYSVLWHPGGKRIAYTPLRNVGNLYWRNADGTGTEERLTTSTRIQLASDWSQDGAALLFTECDSGYVHSCDIGRVLMTEEPMAELLLATRANEQHPALSPDGQWLAYESDQSGRFEVYVRPYPNVDTGRWQVSTNGGKQPVWSSDGDVLYYAAGHPAARQMQSVTVNTDSGFQSGAPTPVFDFRQEGYAELRSYDLHPDGDRFLLVTRDKVLQSDEQLVYVHNWLDEVERLVPTNP